MTSRLPRVALETTLLLHGVPREVAASLRLELDHVVREAGADPALVGVVAGRPVAGISDAEFRRLLDAVEVPKLNTGNLGVTLSRGGDGATTVSTTMEIAAAAGIRVFATGGLGGVHEGYGQALDISADLAALARFPVAVVCSGVKSILDVRSTREALESLGVPVVGYRTEWFPAFYLQQTTPPIGVDARFDDMGELAAYVRRELARSGRGVVVANPIDSAQELEVQVWEEWLGQAKQEALAAGVSGRGVTPFVLGRLHAVSGGATLRANVELVKSNARVAGELAAKMASANR